MSGTPELRRLTGENPFGVDPALDLLHTVRDDVPGWSETMYFMFWSPPTGVGAFIHIGRWANDLDLWYGQVLAMLPGGNLLVDRSWGRSTDPRGPATGNVAVTCLEPLRRWRLRFDGAGEPSTLASLAAGPVGAGRAAAFGFEIELDAAAGIWDIASAGEIDTLAWARKGVHHVQGHRARGTLRSEGSSWEIDGVAVRDHSSGPRDVSDISRCHHFAWVFPDSGRVVNGTTSWRLDGTANLAAWASQRDGECVVGEGFRYQEPALTELATLAPRAPEVELSSGETFTCEVLHGYVLTMLEPNININGAAHDEAADPLFITQGAVRVTSPTGDVGFGVLERDTRRSLLPGGAPGRTRACA